MLDRIISIFAPHYCISCNKIGSRLCADCNDYIVLRELSACLNCHSPLLLNNCLNCALPYSFIAVYAPREGLLQQLIDEYKFYGARTLARPLADIIARGLPYFPGNVVLTSVPTARPHIRERGYDHMKNMTMALATARQLEFIPLLKRRRTARQLGHDRQTRIEQTKDLYWCDQSLDSAVTYIIVDDVVTTGATMASAAQALRDAGAQKVAVIALAYQSSQSTKDML